MLSLRKNLGKAFPFSMTTLTDWNCQLLPSPWDEGRSPQGIALALEGMYRQLGISHFHLMPAFDPERESVSAFLHRTKRIQEALSPHLLPAISLQVGTAVSLSPSISDLRELDQLLHRSTLCVSLPLCSYADWIDQELNRLLFHHRLRLTFLSFEKAVILYPKEIIEKLLRIKNAAFQFSFRSLQETAVLSVIQTLLRERKTVLLGSEINTPEKICQYDLPYYLDCAKRFLGERDVRRLLSNR